MTVVLPKALLWMLGLLVAVGVVGAAYVAGTMSQPSSSGVSPTTVATRSAPAASASFAASPTIAATSSPAPTASPSPNPTAAPTRTATPGPTPITFTRADGGTGTTSGRHTGIFGVVLAEATTATAAQSRRLQVTAYIPAIGSLERPSASARLYNDFRAPAGAGNIQAQVTGRVNWKGILAGNGAAGAGAGFKLDVKVLEGNGVVASHTVHSKEMRESAMTVGGFDDIDEGTFSFAANLVAGRLYRVQVEATCNAFTGLIGTVTHCIYGPSDVYDDGFVEWTELTVRF